MKQQLLPSRAEVPKGDTWDLTPLFGSDAAWEKLYTEIEAQLPRYAAFRGRLASSFETFRDCVVFDLELSRAIEKVYTYAHLKADEDTADQRNQGLSQRAMNLYTRLSEEASFISPEIQTIPDDTLRSFAQRPEMKEYAFYLEKIVRAKPHTLSIEIEQILAMGGEVAQAPAFVFSQLDNADLRFGTIVNEKGEEMELSHGTFQTFLISRDRAVRERAFRLYYKAYDDHKNTIAASLSSSCKKDVFYSRVRKFENARRAALFSDNVADAVYDNLVEAVRKNTAPLFKYLRFRREALGLDELRMFDTYVPLVGDVEFHLPYNEAVKKCIQALAPLGEEYTTTLERGLLGGWVDRYENRGKRSGAYSSGCYDSPPYILMNYREDAMNSLYTLIHEAGHSMHSWYSIKNQPYVNSGYTIFVAEVASTFNEILLSRHLLSTAGDDPRMRAYILNREIDNIRATLYRQTMFAEYEKVIHERVERNEPLTREVLTGCYRELLDAYFGDTVVIDPELELEGLRIPHFYSAFYVYKYATGISAAIALAQKVLGEGEPARDAYLRFLKLGGSMYPIDELKTAGVDMSSPEPVESAIRYFAGLVDELVAVWGKIS